MCADHSPMPFTAVSSRISSSSGSVETWSRSSSPDCDVLGERAQEAHLRAREPDRGAQLLGVVVEDLLRRRRPAAEALEHPAPHDARDGRRQLLADDRPDQRGVVVAVAVGVALELDVVAVDQAGEDRVGRAQVRERRRRSWGGAGGAWRRAAPCTGRAQAVVTIVPMLVRPRFAARLLAPVAAWAVLALLAPAAPGAGARARGPARRRARCSRSCPAPAPAAPVAPGDEDPEPRLPLGARRARRAAAAVPRPQQRGAGHLRPRAGVPRHLAGNAGVAEELRPEGPAAAAPASGRRRRGAARGLAGGPRARREAPADVQPGLLAQSIPGGAGYAGIAGRPHGGGDRRRGPVGARSRSSRSAARATSCAARAACSSAARSSSPTFRRGPRAARALDALVAAHRPGELLLVMQTPPGGTDAQLLPTGALGLGGTPAGRLTSQTTHTDGVVAGIDVAPTILEHLGLAGARRRQGAADHLRARARRRGAATT